ncbi:hypothetical protein FCULG_00000252 [Fusarium culmorum]|uniref:F-box domain-containing protein n=1 Tax=Fusarium culmorum TaxID=5516 RepID=A0A2T4GNU4_FUSCU|nr:hypothetical protein FCULG_00000252 [Fusarium culmorum]
MSQTGTAWAGDGDLKVIPHGYYSATEYQVKEEQADAIIQTAAYHRRDFPLSVIWFSPRTHAHVRSSLSTPFQRTSNAGLGSLDQLPTELLDDIKYRLDVIVSHGLNLFCALLRTRLAVHVSLLDFYDALCTKTCSICGEFGGFMSLLTWKKCCFQCLREAPEIRVLPLDSNPSKPVTVASIHQASLICNRPLPTKARGFAAANRERQNIHNFTGSCALPYYNETKDSVEGEQWRFDARDKLYARDGFLEHFRRCEQAQLLWRTSDEGRKMPPELPPAIRWEDGFNWRY